MKEPPGTQALGTPATGGNLATSSTCVITATGAPSNSAPVDCAKRAQGDALDQPDATTSMRRARGRGMSGVGRLRARRFLRRAYQAPPLAGALPGL